MRRGLGMTLIVTAGLVHSGCAGRQARKYAGDLAGLLAVYRQEIGRKIADEQARYEAAARRYQRERDEDAETRLRMERNERAIRLRKQLSVRPGDADKALDEMKAYAAGDFAATRKIYEAGMDDPLLLVAKLENLRFEEAKAARLQVVLNDLAQDPKPEEMAAQLAGFAADFRAEFAVDQCRSAADRMARFSESKKTLEAAAAALPAGDPLRAAKEADARSLGVDIQSLQAVRDASGAFSGGRCVAANN
jgi:hypothetical protein